MSVSRFFLLGLLTFRLQRLITADTFPPSKAFRGWVDRRFGEASGWAELVNCSWCAGLYCAGIVVAVDHFWTIPLWVLLVAAFSVFAGILGSYD